MIFAASGFFGCQIPWIVALGIILWGPADLGPGHLFCCEILWILFVLPRVLETLDPNFLFLPVILEILDLDFLVENSWRSWIFDFCFFFLIGSCGYWLLIKLFCCEILQILDLDFFL